MKIEIKHYGNTYSVETQNDDLDIHQVMDHIYGLLIQATFSRKTIISGMLDLIEEKED